MNKIEYTEQQETILRMIEDPANSLEDIRDASGYSSTMCVTQFLRNNLGMHHFPKTRARMEKEARNLRICELRELGLSQCEIADSIGISAAVVGVVLRNAGYVGAVERFCIRLQSRKCPVCDKSFLTEVKNKVYCSETCEKKATRKVNDIKRRSREKAVVIDRNITLSKVVKMYNNRCALCGGLVDWDDVVFVNGKKFASRRYPSIDHIVPLAKGGTHSWKNVQLAHFGCNASKGAGNE